MFLFGPKTDQLLMSSLIRPVEKLFVCFFSPTDI